ncbi:hypothetical protein M0802_004190 [Mischocyttarus mexicanus]|nr:hypothetical protein M0802_004190 [Mischocyttarus mexicanus]
MFDYFLMPLISRIVRVVMNSSNCLTPSPKKKKNEHSDLSEGIYEEITFIFENSATKSSKNYQVEEGFISKGSDQRASALALGELPLKGHVAAWCSVYSELTPGMQGMCNRLLDERSGYGHSCQIPSRAQSLFEFAVSPTVVRFNDDT